MGKINENTLQPWKDGDVVTAGKYKQERSILTTAINDNHERIIDRHTKEEIEGMLKDLYGEGRSTENIMGLSKLIQEIFDTHYAKSQVDVLLEDKQRQIYSNEENIRILKRDKLSMNGDFLGTWHGVTMSEASEPINGGRLDVLEPAFKQVQSDLYDVSNTHITITHNLKEFPLVHVVGELPFGASGFGLFGFGGSVIAYPTYTEYTSENELIVHLHEDFGDTVVERVTDKQYKIKFVLTDLELSLKLI